MYAASKKLFTIGMMIFGYQAIFRITPKMTVQVISIHTTFCHMDFSELSEFYFYTKRGIKTFVKPP